MSWYEAQEVERGISSVSGRPCAIRLDSGQNEMLILENGEREQKQHQKTVSRLAERAEKAEVEASQLRVELESMRDLASARVLVGMAYTVRGTVAALVDFGT